MQMMDQKLKAFFAEYEARTNRALSEKPVVDIEATAAAFTEYFIEANPNGVLCGKNDEEFRAKIPQGFEFYRSIGTQSMNITSLDITPLDDYHAMVKVHWVADYKKQDKTGSTDTIQFDVIYLLQLIGEQPKVFGYITGDEQKLYRERGLISD